MSTLDNRPNTALLVVDVQRSVIDESINGEAVVQTIDGLVSRARDAGTPVVWVQHSDDEMPIDSDGWQLAAPLAPSGEEPVVHKRHGDSFEGTDLEEQLAALQVGSLVVAGAQTDACIRSTLHGAFARGYDATLVEDAHTTSDMRQWVPGLPAPEQVIAHTNTYRSFQSAPGRKAGVVKADDVTF